MALAIVTKQSGENFPLVIEYSGRLPTGTALSSGAIAAVNTFTNTTDNTILDSTTATISGTQAQGRLVHTGGSDGERFKVTFTTTLDDGSILEDEVIVIIDNSPS